MRDGILVFERDRSKRIASEVRMRNLFFEQPWLLQGLAERPPRTV